MTFRVITDAIVKVEFLTRYAYGFPDLLSNRHKKFRYNNDN